MSDKYIINSSTLTGIANAIRSKTGSTSAFTSSQMNKKEWLDQENQDYRLNTELRFKEYYLKYKEYFETIDEQEKNQIIVGMKNRMFQEGLMMESITFSDWIQEILKLN